MSRAKNRCITRGIVHYVKRGVTRNGTKANYRFQTCNNIVVYNYTDKDMALTCLLCIAKEQHDHRTKGRRRGV